MAVAPPVHPFQTDRVSLERPLAGPFLQIDLADDIDALRRESAFARNGHNARTLAKYDDLRIVLEVARRGTRMTTHEPGEQIAVHVLRGRVRLHVGDEVVDARAGQLVAMDRSSSHDIAAADDCAFLLYVSGR
ncbi:MAG TPA: cupin domain-containing protein [Anaeromyxobacteraceae bacterium]